MKKTYLLLFIALLFMRGLQAAAPPNDACSSAIALTVNATCIRGTTYGGTTQTGENLTPSCMGAAFTQTVWYKFTATATTMYVQLYADSFAGTGATWSPAYWAAAVYNSTICPPSAASMIKCQNSNSHGTNDKIIVDSLANLTVGNTYLVQVGYRYSGSGLVPKFCIKAGSDFTQVCNTCANPCGPACGFSSNPTVSQVTSSCPYYAQWPYAEGNQSVSQCYTFTAVSSTVSYQVIVQSTCGAGNVTSLTWTLYRSGSCGGAIQSGTLSNMTFTGLTPGVHYTYCYTLTVPPGCYHIQYWPYFVGAAPLPVELISFIGDESSEGVELKWTTASEINNDHFIIERSGSPDLSGSEYEFVGKVPGVGNSTTLNEYRLVDPKPLEGINYYHLIQVDYDGTTHDYAPIAVNYLRNNRAMIVPNPVNNSATLDYFSDAEKTITVSIIDQIGRLVFSKQQTVTGGKNSLPLNTSFLSQGIYFLNIADEETMQHVRFSK